MLIVLLCGGAGFVACGVLYLVSPCALSTRSASVSALDSALELSYAYDLVQELRLDAPRHQIALPPAPEPEPSVSANGQYPYKYPDSSLSPSAPAPVHLSMLAANVAQNKLYAVTRAGVYMLAANFTRPAAAGQAPGQAHGTRAHGRPPARATGPPTRHTAAQAQGRARPKHPTPAALRGATPAKPNAASAQTPLHSPQTLINFTLLFVALLQAFIQFHRL